MQHFSEHAWADWVRGVATPGTTAALQAHIASSCPECNGAMNLWSEVGSLARAESSYAPPENLVRLVKLEFACKHAPEAECTPGSLIYDSWINPLPIGIRGAAVSTRQVLYEAEGLTIDLRFEHKPHSNTVHASGQILSKDAPLCWVSDAAIVLWNDKGRMVASTDTNRHGEFQFEFEVQDQLRLSIATVGRKTLRIPLGNLT
ncbi:MAG: hypothetical protein DMG68_08085 [Acidobacteria bacterium]|jgi:hypothetical protein|nr:MAG: hypothetical protein DMG68_08085 [Acidobacteriota bacterium]